MAITALFFLFLTLARFTRAQGNYGNILAEQLNQYCDVRCGKMSFNNTRIQHRRGKAGLPGIRGPIGPVGAPGIIGPQGIIGQSGPRGPVGEKGVPGVIDYDRIEEMITTKILAIVEYSGCNKLSQALVKIQNATGVYDIYPDFYKNGINVYCDFDTDEGGWTVFQRRMDGSVNFTRNWNDYVNGFGNLEGEFWMGLEKLHRLTSNGNFELRVDLADWEGNTAYAKYSTFSVGNAADKYRLTVRGYSGDAGDSLKYHNNYRFSTFDQDNDDTSSRNCAADHKGGWWFKSCNSAFLNGLYLRGKYEAKDDHGGGWELWKGQLYSLKFSEMKFRPKL